MNFVSKDTPQRDIDLLFGPLDPKTEGDKIVFMENNWTMADIAVHLQIFPSKSQAKKNGWDSEIPMGFAAHTRKRKKWPFQFWTFKNDPDWVDDITMDILCGPWGREDNEFGSQW